jgi:hypothetical protein
MNRSIDSSAKVSASTSSLRTPSRNSPRGTSGKYCEELYAVASFDRKSLDGEDSWMTRPGQPEKFSSRTVCRCRCRGTDPQRVHT